MPKPKASADRDEKGRYLPAHSIPGPGRPSDYDPSMNEMAYKLALLGLADDEMAEFFGVDRVTFYRWQDEYPAFRNAVHEGKTPADANVARALYNRAVGQVVVVEKSYRGDDGEVRVVALKQEVPADPGSAKLWLTNRRRKNWRDKQDIGFGEDGDNNINLNLTHRIVGAKSANG